jgi:pimeloyl-ACP methyl ester carboxylesterase
MNVPQIVVRGDGGRVIEVAGGVDIHVETFGEPSDPAVLLSSGFMTSMDCWEDEFCRRLAASGRYVVRYDHRDTGGSVTYPVGSPPYGFDELVSDVVGVLDGVGAAQAHVVGVSMGGGIGQRLALEYPDRVLSLTLISTSPGLRPAAPPAADLPSMAPELEAHFTDPATKPQHNHVLLDPGAPYRSRLGAIDVPTLVVHGVEDPLFPFGHAEASAREIRGAELIPLEGVGHELLPRHTWDALIPKIVEHTRDRSAAR